MSSTCHVGPTLVVKQQKKKSQNSPNTGCAGRRCETLMGWVCGWHGPDVHNPHMGVLRFIGLCVAVLIIGKHNGHYRNLYGAWLRVFCSSGLTVNVASLPLYVGLL